MLKKLKLALNFFLDFWIPRLSLDGSTIHEFLTIEEAKKYRFKNKKEIPQEFKKYIDDLLIGGNYDFKLLDSLIYRAKFGGELAICKDLIRLLTQKLEDNLSNPDLITSVPPDPIRKAKRGFHLPEILAKELAQEYSLKYQPIFKKVKSTVPQTSLKRKERLENLSDKFQILPEFKISEDENFTVWIIDDVITTGSTLAETAKTLKTKFPNVKIVAMAICGSEKDFR